MRNVSNQSKYVICPKKYSTSPAFVKSQGVPEDTREIQDFRV